MRRNKFSDLAKKIFEELANIELSADFWLATGFPSNIYAVNEHNFAF